MLWGKSPGGGGITGLSNASELELGLPWEFGQGGRHVWKRGRGINHKAGNISQEGRARGRRAKQVWKTYAVSIEKADLFEVWQFGRKKRMLRSGWKERG